MMGDDVLQDVEMQAAFIDRRVYPMLGVGRQSYSDSDILKEKIISAFLSVTSFPLKGIMFQFWAPEKTLLTCKDYPYANVAVNRRHTRYRNFSENYQYSIDDVNKVGIEEKLGDSNSIIISGGLPARAFVNKFPEVVVDLRAHQGKGDPLVDLALECEFTCSIMLPVFLKTSNDCVGVVECSMKVSGLLVIFNELKTALKLVGLSFYHLQGSWPYKVVCESHVLTLGQVWIPYESESHHHVPSSSSSLEETKRSFLVKLTGYGIQSTDDALSSSITDFYENCDVMPLRMGEGLAGKTLETCQPQFCRNIYKLDGDYKEGGVLAILSANTKCSRLVICLRSTYTDVDDLNYVFEFFWPRSRDYSSLLRCLLSNLKRWLPSFKFASGAQLGDELCVVDVTKETSTLGSGVKRKFSDLNPSNQEHLTSIYYRKTDDDEDVDDDDDEVIVVYYRLGCTLILLPKRSATLENAMKKVIEDLDLDPTWTYNLRYEANEGEWIGINAGDEVQFKLGLKFRRKIGMPHFNLLLSG